VEYLADNLAGEPVACLVTMRSDERNDAMALARALRARRTGRIVELERLDPAEVAQMAQACLGHGPLPDEADSALKDWTDGVPFFVEELLAAWVGSGTLVRDTGGWSMKGTIEPAVPLTFADIVGRRLSTLGAGGRRVLQAASVIGRRFDWSLLPVMTDRRDDDVLEVLRQATDAQLIAPDVESAGFKFRHALTRDAILDTLLPPQRQALARAGLRVVQKIHPQLPGEWCELSVELALGSGDNGTAAGLLLEAARRAIARGALGTAESFLRRAGALGSADQSTQDGLDDALCETLALAGKVDQASEVAAELLARLQARPGTETLQAQVHLRLARVTVSAERWADAEAHLDATRALCPASTDAALDAHRAVLAAQVAIGRGDIPLAQRLAVDALAQAEAAGRPAQVCEALEVHGRCQRRSDLEAAEVAFERARRVAADHGLTLWQLRATHELGGLDVLRGGPIDRLDSAARLARESGALCTAAHVDLQRGFWLFDFHRLDECLITARRTAESSGRFHLQVINAVAHVQQGLIHALRDEPDQMERVISTSSDLCADAPIADEMASILRALLLLRRDDQHRAMEELGRVMAAVRRYGGAPSPFPGLWILLRACTGSGVVEDRAEVLNSAAGPRLQTHAYLDYAEAVEAGRIEDRARAEDLAARAGAFMRRYPWFHHHSRRLIAEAALEDGWGEPLTWLREAHVFFESEGYDPLARACRSLLIRAGDHNLRRARPREGVPADLAAVGITRRELDVLELLADGPPTREIAERLYLSPKTVERHIANLASKVGLAGRAQLVAFAAQRCVSRSRGAAKNGGFPDAQPGSGRRA
jgi:DNA-binding CsgD family transcriptional regulator